MAGFGLFIKFSKMFYWLKLFPEPPGYFLAQVLATFGAIKGFLLMVAIMII